jgi:1,4-dihydroxy-2-naphthoate octaprenyltransferase
MSNLAIAVICIFAAIAIFALIVLADAAIDALKGDDDES